MNRTPSVPKMTNDLNGTQPIDEDRTIDEDRQLVARLVAGQADAWQHFVLQYQTPVAQFLQRQLQSTNQSNRTHDLEDILAEVFTAIVQDDFAALQRFEFKCRLSTWLLVIAKRVCWRHFKRSHRFRQSGNGHASKYEILANLAAPPLLDTYDSETIATVRHRLLHLETRDRELLEMHYFEQLDYRAIAQRLGLSVNSIGPKLHRAHMRLKKLMRSP